MKFNHITFFPRDFRVKVLLSDAQGLKKGFQHPLPWYPPVCVTLADIPEGDRSYDNIQSVKDRTKVPLRLFDLTMKDVSFTLKRWWHRRSSTVSCTQNVNRHASTILGMCARAQMASLGQTSRYLQKSYKASLYMPAHPGAQNAGILGHKITDNIRCPGHCHQM